MSDKSHQNIQEHRISEIGYAVRTAFALGHAKGKGIAFEQGPELDRLIQQTAERLNLTGDVLCQTLHPHPDKDITMTQIQNIVDQQGWNDDTRLQLAEGFIESSGQLEAYLEHLRQTAAGESTDEADGENQNQLLCHLCAEPFIIETGGIANHVDEYGNIDHDLDEEHAPYILKDSL